MRAEAAALEATMPKQDYGYEAPAYQPPELDDDTLVVVCGANGICGSAVANELLERGCRVRAVVRSAEDVESYERLSYAVGAESLQGEIEAPWIIREDGGPMFDSPATYSAPEDDSLADTSDEVYRTLTPYGQNQVRGASSARVEEESRRSWPRARRASSDAWRSTPRTSACPARSARPWRAPTRSCAGPRGGLPSTRVEERLLGTARRRSSRRARARRAMTRRPRPCGRPGASSSCACRGPAR